MLVDWILVSWKMTIKLLINILIAEYPQFSDNDENSDWWSDRATEKLHIVF